MDAEEPLSRAEARALLAYADVTYRSVTSVRRKLARGAVVLAVVFGVGCAWATTQWAADRSRLDAIEDRPLVDVMGVQLPDPRPAIERSQVRVQVLFWGFVAVSAGGMTLLWLGVYWLIRPPALPAEIRELQARPPP